MQRLVRIATTVDMGEDDGSASSGKLKCINPSLGIVRRWQGIVELILRAVTIVSLMVNTLHKKLCYLSFCSNI